MLLLATTSLQLPHHATRQSSPGPAGPVRTAYGKLPLSFEPNQGQTDRGVDYVARGKGYTLLLSPREARLALQQPAHAHARATMRLRFEGANRNARLQGVGEMAGKSIIPLAFWY